MIERWAPVCFAALIVVVSWWLTLPLIFALVVFAASLAWAFSLAARAAPEPPAVVKDPQSPTLSEWDGWLKVAVEQYERKSKLAFAESHCLLVLGNAKIGKTQAIFALWSDDDLVPLPSDEGARLRVFWVKQTSLAVIEVPADLLSPATVHQPQWPGFCRALLRARRDAAPTGVLLVADAEKQAEFDVEPSQRLKEQLSLLAAPQGTLPVWLVVTRCDRLAAFRKGADSLEKHAGIRHLSISRRDNEELDFDGFVATLWSQAAKVVERPELQTSDVVPILYLCGVLERLCSRLRQRPGLTMLHQRPLRFCGIWFGCAEHVPERTEQSRDLIAEEWPKSLLENTADSVIEGGRSLFLRGLFDGLEAANPSLKTEDPLPVAAGGWWDVKRSRSLYCAGLTGLAVAGLLSPAAVVGNRIALSSAEVAVHAVGSTSTRADPPIELARERLERLQKALAELHAWRLGAPPLYLRLFDATGPTCDALRSLFARRFTAEVGEAIARQAALDLRGCSSGGATPHDTCRVIAVRYLMVTGPRDPGDVAADIPLENVRAVTEGWRQLYHAAGYIPDRSSGEERLRSIVQLYLEIARNEELAPRDPAVEQIALAALR